MANNFSSATLGLGIDTKQFNKEIGATSRDTRKMLESMKLSADAFSESWRSMTAGIKDTKRIVAGILVSQSFYALINVLTEGGAAALKFSRDMETAAISMEYFVKGAEKTAKAQAFLNTMNVFAARTPFSTSEAIALSKYMQAVGVAMGTTKSFLQVITDTAAATGATEENLQRIVFGLGQMMTKGRIANEEIRQLANANIPIYEILQEQLGLTGEQISQIGRHWVSADKAIVAILTGLENRYKGAADRIAETVTGMTDTILDNSKIIGQITFAGAYEGMSDNMRALRDTLDVWRAIASEGIYVNRAGKIVKESIAEASAEIEKYYAGSAGLFNYILTQMDTTGELGTKILALIGNTKQLGAALSDLYTAGKPLINLFGNTLYTTITLLEITLTSISRSVEVAIKGLEKLGLTTGTTAQVLSSLFIAYKAAKWMAFLGQGITSAGYAMYKSISAASAMLPALAQMSVGAKLATTAFFGLGLSLLSAYGIFKMLNNAMAGLDTTTSAGNIFPDDYSEAMSKYEAAMKEYNAQIAKYSEEYSTPFTTIDDEAEGAITVFEDVADASKKAASSVKKDWIAAFDEVYSIPDSSGSELGDLLEKLEDLGTYLALPVFKFPSIPDTIELKVPQLEDFYDNAILEDIANSDVLDGNWWRVLIPVAIMGAAKNIGDMYAKHRAERDADATGKSGPGGGSGGSNLFQNVKDAVAALKAMSQEVEKMEQSVAATLETIKSGKIKTGPELDGLYKKLALQTDALIKYLDKVNIQAIVAGVPNILKSTVAIEAKTVTLQHLIEKNVDLYNETLKATKDLGYTGDKATTELNHIKRELMRQYDEYKLLSGDPSGAVADSLKPIIDITGVIGRIDKVNEEVANMRVLLTKSNYAALDIKSLIQDTVKLAEKVASSVEELGIDNPKLADNTRILNSIKRLLDDQLKLSELTTELESIKNVLATKDVQTDMHGKINTSALRDTVEAIEKRILSIKESIDVQTAVIKAGSWKAIEDAKKAQEILNNKIPYNHAINTISTYIDEIVKPLKAIEIYNKRILFENKAGATKIGSSFATFHDLLAKVPKEVEAILRPILEPVISAYKEALQTGEVPSLTLEVFSKSFSDVLTKIGETFKADTSTIASNTSKMADQLSKISGKYDILDETIKKIERATAERAKTPDQTRAETATRSILDTIQDKLEAFADKSPSLKDYDAYQRKLITQFRDIAFAEQEKLYRILSDQAKTNGGPAPVLAQIPNIFVSSKGAIAAIMLETRRELVARLRAAELSGEQAGLLLTAHKELNPAFNTIAGLAKDLRYYADAIVGTGIRSSRAYLAETGATPYLRNIEAGYISAEVVKAGIFDIFSEGGQVNLALKTSEIAGLFGQSGYGTTIFSAIADRLTEIARAQAGIPTQLSTLRTIINQIIGQIAKLPTLTAAKDILTELKLTTAGGATFYSPDRLLQGVIDGLVYNPQGHFVAPLDAITMSNFGNKLLPILKDYGVQSGNLIALSQDGFNRLLTSFDDLAWSIAGQAAIMGTNETYIAVLDKKLAGLDTLNFDELSRYDVTNKQIADAVRREISSTVATYVADHLKDIKAAVKLIAVRIPDKAIYKALIGARQFKDTLNLVSVNKILGANIAELITPVNMIGEKIGSLTPERYDSSIYDAPKLGDKAANEFITDLVTDLKSTNMVQRAQAATRIQDSIEKLSKAIYQKGIMPSETRTVELGTTNTGYLAKVTMTGTEMLEKVEQLKTILANIDSRATAITTSLNDLIKKFNYGAEQGLHMNDLSGFLSAKGTPYTMRDLAYAIKNQEAQISTTGNIARQLNDILGTASSNNIAIPITNYTQMADIASYIPMLSANLHTLINPDDDTLKLGGRIQTTMAYEEMLKFARENGWKAGSLTPGQTTFTHQSASKFAQYLEKHLGLQKGQYTTYGNTGNGSAPMTSGSWYSTKGGKTYMISSTAMQNVLGGAGLAVSIGLMAKETIATRKAFEENILPRIPEADREAALTRANQMGITGWTAGINSGQLTKNFLELYKTMSEIERIYWGQIVASKAAPDINMAGSTELEVLQAVLAGAEYQNIGPDRGVIKLGLDLDKQMGYMIDGVKNLSDKEILSKAMEDGIENSALAVLVDYIVTSGDTNSDLAKDFYDRFGDYMNEVVAPSYGLDPAFQKELQHILNSENESIKAFLQQVGIKTTDATDLSIGTQILMRDSIIELQDGLEELLLPMIQAKEKYNYGDNPLTSDFSRIIGDIDFSTISKEAVQAFKDTFGIAFENTAEGLGIIKIEAGELADNILGWTAKIPETISLDGANLSVQDLEILSMAGIQVNGDGTVTFMKAMNMNTSGTERTVELEEKDISEDLRERLTEKGMQLDFSKPETMLDLNVNELRENLSGAMFRFNTDLTGQISDRHKELLAELGEVMDSGYFNITNKAILSGEMTIAEYFTSMGDTIKQLSPELEESLLAIDKLVATGGQNTALAVANMADGVVMPSFIDEGELTDELRAALAAVGVNFAYQGEEFVMVINKVGEQIKDGITLIPTETWDRVNDEVIAELKKLGVEITPSAAGVWVDLSDTMANGASEIVKIFTDNPELWSQIPIELSEMLAEAGFAIDNGLLGINLNTGEELDRLGNQWYTTWEALGVDVQNALAAAGFEVSSGMITIEKMTADTILPANIDDYIIKPFDELPAELKERLTGGDESVAAELAGSNTVIKTATETAFVGALDAISVMFGEMNTTAAEGAKELAETIAGAIKDTQTLNDISVKRTWWNPFDNKTGDAVKVTGVPGNYQVKYGGVIYSGIDAKTREEAVKYVENKTGINIPGYRFGGLVSEEGIYRLAEGNQKEGIIPLKNKAGLAVIGKSIVEQLPVASPVQQQQLIGARGLYNGGLMPPVTERPSYYEYMPNYMPNHEEYRSTLSNSESRPVVYVEHLIADDRSLRELERRMQVIRLEEDVRRRGA